MEIVLYSKADKKNIAKIIKSSDFNSFSWERQLTKFKCI